MTGAGSTRLRVSVCDDDPVVRTVFQVWLDAADVDFQLFESAAPFVAAAAETTFDLHIIDHSLGGGIQGPEAVARLRRFSPSPIVVLTGYEPNEVRGTYPAGPNLRIESKPVSFPTLLDWLGRPPPRVAPGPMLLDGPAIVDTTQVDHIARSTSRELVARVAGLCHDSVLETVSLFEGHTLDGDVTQARHLLDRTWGGAVTIGAVGLASALMAVRDRPAEVADHDLETIRRAAEDFQAAMTALGYAF